MLFHPRYLVLFFSILFSQIICADNFDNLLNDVDNLKNFPLLDEKSKVWSLERLMFALHLINSGKLNSDEKNRLEASVDKKITSIGLNKQQIVEQLEAKSSVRVTSNTSNDTAAGSECIGLGFSDSGLARCVANSIGDRLNLALASFTFRTEATFTKMLDPNSPANLNYTYVLEALDNDTITLSQAKSSLAITRYNEISEANNSVITDAQQSLNAQTVINPKSGGDSMSSFIFDIRGNNVLRDSFQLFSDWPSIPVSSSNAQNANFI